MKEPTVAEYAVNQLAAWQVPYVFGVAGDSVGPVIAALGSQKNVRYIGVRQEDAAGFMASAYAKLTGNLGVCLADGGPGCVRLLNGVYDAHFDRQPVLALTGQLPTAKLGTRWPQVMDQNVVYQECAGASNHTLASAKQASDVLPQAMRAAEDKQDVSRLGLPKDLLQEKTAAVEYPRPPYLSQPAAVPPEGDLREALKLLEGAERPLIFVGRGARKARTPLVALAEALDAAIIHTMPALGCVPWNHRLNAGVVGEFGTPAAARLFARADVVLVLGTTWWQPQYAPDATYIQLDKAPAHVGAWFPADVGLVGDALPTLMALSGLATKRQHVDWAGEIQRAREEWLADVKERSRTGVAGRDAGDGGDDGAGDGDGPGAGQGGSASGGIGGDGGGGMDAPNGRAAGMGFHPGAVVEALGDLLADDAVLCLDVGDNTYWVSSGLKATQQTLLLSGHWRSLGFALPAANAARLVLDLQARNGGSGSTGSGTGGNGGSGSAGNGTGGNGGSGSAGNGTRRQVVAVTGDGGFGQVLAEFTTSVYHHLPILCIVLNNGCFAQEQHAQLRMGLQPFGTHFHNPDFAAFAQACGGVGIRVEMAGAGRPFGRLNREHLHDALATGFKSAFQDGQPTIVDVPVTTVMPTFPPRRGNLLTAQKVPEIAHA